MSILFETVRDFDCFKCDLRSEEMASLAKLALSYGPNTEPIVKELSPLSLTNGQLFHPVREWDASKKRQITAQEPLEVESASFSITKILGAKYYVVSKQEYLYNHTVQLEGQALAIGKAFEYKDGGFSRSSIRALGNLHINDDLQYQQLRLGHNVILESDYRQVYLDADSIDDRYLGERTPAVVLGRLSLHHPETIQNANRA